MNIRISDARLRSGISNRNNKPKVDDIYRIQNYWLVTDDGKTKLSADYIGMALMYDETRLLNIIDNNNMERTERLLEGDESVKFDLNV